MSSSRISRPRYLSCAIAQHYGTLLFGTQGKNMCALRSLLQFAHAPPHRRSTDPRHVPSHHQQLRFVSLNPLRRRARFRPPLDPSRGKTPWRQPISLAVVCQDQNRLRASVTKNEHTARKRVFTELGLADANQDRK